MSKSTWHKQNLEATSDGGPASFETIQRQAPMTEAAIGNGVYMRALDKRETVAAMAEILLQYYQEKKQPEAVVALSNLLLARYPQNITVLLYGSAAYNAIIRRDFSDRSMTPDNFRLNTLMGISYSLQQRAFNLGFQPPNQVLGSQYIKAVTKAKTIF